VGRSRDKIALTEKQFEGQVKDLAKIFGWKYYHTWRSFHSPAGFPDCVMVRGQRIIFAELKSEKGSVSEKQQEWLDALGNVGDKDVQVYLWRPDDIEEIVEVLR
jgi:hypothetical protein